MSAFITLGDWGGATLGSYHSTTVDAVAKQMAASASASGVQFLVNTGDNFYYCGIQNTSDPQIEVDYLKPYGQLSSLNVPWYSILGNHEYGSACPWPTSRRRGRTAVHPWQVLGAGADRAGAAVARAAVGDGRPLLVEARAGGAGAHLIHLPRHEPMHLRLPLDGRVGVGPMRFAISDVRPARFSCSRTRRASRRRLTLCIHLDCRCAPNDEGPCKFHANIVGQSCTKQFSWFKKQLAAVPKGDWLIISGQPPARFEPAIS